MKKPFLLSALPSPLAALALSVLSLSLLAGCAETRIRQQAQSALQAGQYEQAVQALETGLKSHPDSATLRAGLVQAHTEGLTRLLTESAAARATGRLDEAAALLKRARPFDPGLRRVGPLLAEIDTERRQLLALKEARQLVEQRKPTAALQVLTDALKDNPRHPELLALQRRLEIDARQAQVRAAQSGLSEARPISLDFRDASLRTVLDVVSRNSGINFILDKDIRQDTRVTVFLKSAKVEEAIDLIVSTYQLAKKVIDGQTILVYPNTPDKQREHQEQVVRVFYLANAEAKNAAAFLKAMLKLREPFVDERTNLLALRDTPENVLLAERLIGLFDAAEPEVLLELEVLEVSSTRLTELGVRFPDSLSLTPLAPVGASGLNLLNIEGITRERVGVSVGGLLINLKRAIGDVNTLSAPRIRVRSKEKAKVLIGDKIPLVTATTGPNGFVADSVSYIDVGLKLEVEPTVYTDDEVAIRIGLEVSTLGTQIKTASGTLAYQIGTRNAATLLRLRDGQTQLLAGLISRSERSSANRVPGLGDVPMVGRLFSSQADAADRTELVLAITPHVLRNLRQPEAAMSELWVGTDASPRLRSVGGRLSIAEEDTAAAPAVPALADAASSSMGAAPGATPPTAPLPPVVQWLAPADAPVGEPVAVTLNLQSLSALKGSTFRVQFRRDQAAFVSAEEGNLFRRLGAPNTFTHSLTPGERPGEDLLSGALLRTDDKAAPAQGSLVKLWFKPLKPGLLELQVLAVDTLATTGMLPRAALPPVLQIQAR
jgi:general secretion pathway protein D